jgi:hypothetical protein
MDVQDGFIVGIFNYCDRWCERCALTSHCRLFADVARADADADAHMAAVIHAPQRPEDAPPPPPRWLEELIEKADGEVAKMTAAELAALTAEPEMPLEHAVTCERATDYCHAVYDWREANAAGREAGVTDPVAVATWFASMIMTKTRRALKGLAAFDGDREFPPDHEGSAKVALLGIDESIAAWQQLAATGRMPGTIAQGLVRELEIIRDDLERAIPCARAFVRPGFDEPEAVRTLDAADC